MKELILGINPFFLVYFIVCIITYFCIKIKKKTDFNISVKVKKSKVIYNNEEAINFVKKIEELGFFKYAEKENIESLKQNFIEYYNPNSEIVSIWGDETGIPLDYRYYTCDGEDLYEFGGFIEMLKTLKPTFEKINYNCLVETQFEDWDEENKWLNHRIKLNGTEYIVFEDFRGNGWGEAAKRFAEILNTEFEKQDIVERIYLVSGGNDGRLVFLNNELYDYIYTVYKNEECKPLEANEWHKVMRSIRVSIK